MRGDWHVTCIVSCLLLVPCSTSLPHSVRRNVSNWSGRRRAGEQIRYGISVSAVYPLSHIYSVGGHRDQSQPVPTQPAQGESNFGDSSVPLFSLYSKISEEEDNKLTDRWQKDADGILIFVSVHVTISVITRMNGTTRPVCFPLP